MDYSFDHYLAAKKTVDDRALNRPVWELLKSEVTSRLSALERPLDVLEIGAGTGTMIERTVDWNLFAAQRCGVSYTAIDASAQNIAAARQRLDAPPTWLTLSLAEFDFFAFADARERHGGFDLLIANAFLDLVDLTQALPLLKQLLRPNGLAYLTINFDGVTSLLPTLDPAFDALVEKTYHQTMDHRIIDGQRSGDSRTGRILFEKLAAADFTVLLAGSSDWVVHAVDGAYMHDEASFLHFIVQTIQGALSGNLQIAPDRLAQWGTDRHGQIERGELVYVTHQLDFLARV